MLTKKQGYFYREGPNMNRTHVEIENRIQLIRLERQDALNAIDDLMNDELANHWRNLEEDDTLDVGILTGSESTFSVGADLKTYISKWTEATALDIRQNKTGLGGGLTRGNHRMPKPVIAAINGAAIGGGLELALACDIRIASEDAFFGVYEVRMGIHQGDGGLVRLSKICGMGVALDLSLTGRKVNAEEALALGLVSKVVPPEALMPTAFEYANMILKNGQSAVRSVKETLMDIEGLSFDAALKLEGQYGYSSPGNYQDLKERTAAFFAKRKD